MFVPGLPHGIFPADLAFPDSSALNGITPASASARAIRASARARAREMTGRESRALARPEEGDRPKFKHCQFFWDSRHFLERGVLFPYPALHPRNMAVAGHSRRPPDEEGLESPFESICCKIRNICRKSLEQKNSRTSMDVRDLRPDVLVSEKGLEPLRLAAGDFKSPVSTIPPLGQLAREAGPRQTAPASKAIFSPQRPFARKRSKPSPGAFPPSSLPKNFS